MVSRSNVQVTIVVIIFTLLAGLTVLLRLSTRVAITKRVGYDDVCIVLAMTFSVSLTVVTAEQVAHGLGYHGSELDSSDVVITLKVSADPELEELLWDWVSGNYPHLRCFVRQSLRGLGTPYVQSGNIWASLWLYNLALTMTKVSVLLQFLRCFPFPRYFRLACFAMLTIVTVHGAWAVTGNVFMCSPIPFFWNKSSTDTGLCMNESIVSFTNAGMNIAQDVIILLLPMPVIRKLQMAKNQKKGLRIAFAIGLSAVVVSVIRLYSLRRFGNSSDPIFDNVAHAILSAVELNVSIICASLPATRPFLVLMMPRCFSSIQKVDYVGVHIWNDVSRYASTQPLDSIPGVVRHYSVDDNGFFEQKSQPCTSYTASAFSITPSPQSSKNFTDTCIRSYTPSPPPPIGIPPRRSSLMSITEAVPSRSSSRKSHKKRHSSRHGGRNHQMKTHASLDRGSFTRLADRISPHIISASRDASPKFAQLSVHPRELSSSMLFDTLSETMVPYERSRRSSSALEEMSISPLLPLSSSSSPRTMELPSTHRPSAALVFDEPLPVASYSDGNSTVTKQSPWKVVDTEIESMV